MKNTLLIIAVVLSTLFVTACNDPADQAWDHYNNLPETGTTYGDIYQAIFLDTLFLVDNDVYTLANIKEHDLTDFRINYNIDSGVLAGIHFGVRSLTEPKPNMFKSGEKQYTEKMLIQALDGAYYDDVLVYRHNSSVTGKVEMVTYYKNIEDSL